jgi:excisionase family DNA binding protein
MKIETNEVNEVNEVIQTEPKRGRGRPRKYATEGERVAVEALVRAARIAAKQAEHDKLKAEALERARSRVPADPGPLLVNVAQTAQMLQVSKETVRCLIRAKHLPATKIFGILRIQRDAVTQLAAMGTTGTV